MTTEHTNNSEKGFFRASDNGTQAGRITYVWAGTNKIIIDHTEVNPAYNGKGIGKQLVLAAADFARTHQLKVIPLCPFAKAFFSKNPGFEDILS
ncbi:MAG TPA: GNAT family N-acetyltransferase [Flavobacterium sp.]|jgi:hypothetical protein